MSRRWEWLTGGFIVGAVIGELCIVVVALHFYYASYGHRQYWAFLGVLATCCSALAVSLTVVLILRQIGLQGRQAAHMAEQTVQMKRQGDLLEQQTAALDFQLRRSLPYVSLEVIGCLGRGIFLAVSCGRNGDVVDVRLDVAPDPRPHRGHLIGDLMPQLPSVGSLPPWPLWVWDAARLTPGESGVAMVPLPEDECGHLTVTVRWTDDVIRRRVVRRWLLYRMGAPASSIPPMVSFLEETTEPSQDVPDRRPCS
jgi:hypothetical protein